ncbi:hypothetical protein S40293_05092 [Stachybotrys chartarum IBT 40293]|nr:hypothetical protein S40293_05092 [Stachybotrys chartarum IBT 40293]
MRRTLQSALVLGLSTLVAAVFRDEVGHIDFHHALVGMPQVETTFFHRPRKEDKASLLYTLSDIGIIGAVNPASGALVWRQRISENITVGGGHLRAPESENWVAAALGQRVQVWNGLTGRNIWQADFAGEVKDLEIMEVTENSRKDVLVLFHEDNATILRRLHGKLGTVVWEFREVNKDIPLQISTDISNIYLIGLHGSPGSYTIKVTSLDTVTGSRVSDAFLGNKGEIQGAQDVMFVGANSAAPLVAWTNPTISKLSVQVLGSKSKQEILLAPDVVDVNLHAPHTAQSQPHFLVHTRTEAGNRAEVYHTDLKTGKITLSYELPHIRGVGAFSTSSDNANVYFTRISYDEVMVFSSESPAVLARWEYTKKDAEFVHAVSEVVKKPAGEGFAVRSAGLTDTEDWVLVQNGAELWSRPESLSAAVAAVWAEIPEEEEYAKVLEEEAHTSPVSAFIHRVTRHFDELKYLPDYLASIPSRLINSVMGSEATTTTEGLHRDSFGFNKIIVLATRRGRVAALNTGNHGEVLWSSLVFPQWEGEKWDVVGTISHASEGTVTIRGSKGESVTVKVLTGEIIEKLSGEHSMLVARTATINTPSGKRLLSIGVDGRPLVDFGTEDIPKEILVIRNHMDVLKGIKFLDKGGVVEATELWQLEQFVGKKIVSIATRPAHDPVASIGRVLGDRRVSYKYLNPNTLVVAALEADLGKLSVNLVDTVSGQVLVSQVFEGVDGSKDISCVMSENWYACTFFGQYLLDDGSNQSIKGYQLVVTDLYESPEANDRGPLGDAANFSSLNPVDSYRGIPVPWAVSQAYVISQPIHKLSVTQTRQGIANRQLLGYLPESHALVGIPRQVLDPRRPVDRAPTPAEIEAEGLIKYSPAMEIDALSMLSHQLDVVGIEGIVATPAVVESTSLVVAYGVDVYGTRVAPSGAFDMLGKGFDKITLLLTVLALFAGVTFLAPMVRRKQINRIWEAPS